MKIMDFIYRRLLVVKDEFDPVPEAQAIHGIHHTEGEPAPDAWGLIQLAIFSNVL